MKVVIAIVVVALLALYLFLSARRLWRSVSAAMKLLASVSTQLAAPLSKYPALPADPPLASPFESQRRVAAWRDLQRVQGERQELRLGRLRRSRNRWQTIDPEREPYSRLDRKAAKEAWENRRSIHCESAAVGSQP